PVLVRLGVARGPRGQARRAPGGQSQGRGSAPRAARGWTLRPAEEASGAAHQARPEVPVSLTAAQMELRRSATGSSEIAAVAELNPYAGPFDIYLEKRDEAPPRVLTDRLWLGEKKEPLLADYAIWKLKLVRCHPCETKMHPTAPFLCATLDRWIEL